MKLILTVKIRYASKINSTVLKFNRHQCKGMSVFFLMLLMNISEYYDTLFSK